MSEATNNQPPSSVSYFEADQPVEHREDDRLGRRAFAESIARQIHDVPADHGFTIAVTGEWGSGKTSVLNMVAETLEYETKTTAVLRFNPWLFGCANELVTRFFQELSGQLGQSQTEKLKAIAKLLSTLGQELAPLSPVPSTGLIAKLTGKVVDRWANPRSLHSEREELRKALAESGSRVVVLIDDIDRLEPAETREVMRLVRLTSDLPNVVFLLAFDRIHVAKSLGEDEEKGQQYLEKIVQVTYNLPVVREAILPEILVPLLEGCIQGHDIVELDPEVMGRIFYDIIKPLLRNLRDVKRYLSSLPVALEMIGQEVALADLLALEAIRVLRPALFEDLKSHSDCLVRSSSDIKLMMGLDTRKREVKTELKDMLERAETDRGLLDSVFRVLFPETQEILGNSTYGPVTKTTWRKDRRVACEEVLRAYLHGGLDDAVVPTGDIQALVEALTDETKLTALVDSLDVKQFEQALERLEDYQGDYPTESVPVAVPILTNQMGRLSKEPDGFLPLAPRFKATRVILRLFWRMPDPQVLSDCMDNILAKTNALSGKLHLVEMVGYRESMGHRLVNENRAGELEKQIVLGLTSATTEQLRAEWDLSGLSLDPMMWLHSNEKEDLGTKLRGHLKDDEFVLALLRSAAGKVRYSTGRTTKRLPWNALFDVFGEDLEVAVNRLVSPQVPLDISDEDRDTINLAQEYSAGAKTDGWNDI